MSVFLRSVRLIPVVFIAWWGMELGMGLDMGMGMTAAFGMQAECGNRPSLEHTFDSGASWSLCVDVSENHGLSINSLHYRAPGNFSRPVLQQLHLAQVLLHYHDEPLARAQISPAATFNGAGSSPRTVTQSAASCDGQIMGTPGKQNTICSRIKDNRTLAKYAQRPSLDSQSWELSVAFQRSSLTWTSTVTLTEDGTIRPQASLSGRLNRTSDDSLFASEVAGQAAGQPVDSDTVNIDENAGPLVRATVLATWRAVFNLDTSDADKVEQYEFPLDESQGNRRPMRVTAIETESFRQINPELFRGWRVFDSTGAGYYLDPSNNGHRYVSKANNWTQFNVGFTTFNPCENYSSLNRALSNDTNCGDTLDNFISGESLANRTPVLWYNQSRTLTPSQEHWPVIAELALTFDLLPFDWTPSSPFEVIE